MRMNRLIRFLSLDTKTKERLFNHVIMLVQIISVIVIIINLPIINILILVFLIFLSILLVTEIILLFKEKEVNFDSTRIIIDIKTIYPNTVEHLFKILSIPSVQTAQKGILIFGQLNFAIKETSKSLICQTLEKTEKEFITIYKNLEVFIKNFEEEKKKSTDENIMGIQADYIIELYPSDKNVHIKEEEKDFTKTFNDDIEITRNKKMISIYIPSKGSFPSWDTLRKRIKI